MTEYLLGLDIGGTGVKAGLYTVSGEAVSMGYGEYPMVSTVPGQAEHDPEAWWQQTVLAIRQAVQAVPPEAIRAIGISCTNGLIAVDRQGQPLGPAIMLWDQRALPEVERIRQTLGAENVFRVAGNPAAPGAYSLPTILWLKHHRPELFAAAHKLMVPGGYLIARLTGEFTMDYTRACTTLLFDIVRKQWHQPFLEALDIPPEKLPRPLPCHEIAGVVNDQAAALTGLRAGTPVIAGCMDSVAASLGSGAMAAGDCFIIMGTAARICTPLAEPEFDDRFMNCTHVLPNMWLAIGAINGAGSSLRWFRDTFGQMESAVAEMTGRDVYDLLTVQASDAPPGSKGLVFLPYMSGERTPIWNPYARGVFFGVTLGHNRHDFLRSVLEGAAYAIRHALELLEQKGNKIGNIRIGGAAATSKVWNQIIADVLGKTVVNLVGEHTEVLGAALLAGVATNTFADYETGIASMVRLNEEFTPDPLAHAAYDQVFPIYKQLYPDVKEHMERLSGLDMPKVWVTKLH